MILELDIGNSRIKWRLLESHDSGVLSKGTVLNLAELKTRFVSQHTISSVRVASVRDAGFLAELSDWVQQRWRVNTEVARVVRTCRGLTVAYDDLSRLGVDRWLAMLAAFEDAQDACMVVDCGTAATIDLINKDGQHLGGFIVPGVQLMPRALTNFTGISLADFAPSYKIEAGASTGDAVYNGALSMLVAFVEKNILHESAKEQDGTTYKVYITGGDADLICQNLAPLQVQLKVIPGLVFDGLAIALEDHRSGNSEA